MPGRPHALHYQGDYGRLSAKLRAAAYANPDTRCWRCRRTLAEVRQDHPRAKWTAGHVIQGLPGAPLAPECSPCASAEGAAITNAKRKGRQRTDLTW